MKKLLMVLSLAVMTMTASAVPAKKGVWKTLTLTNGTEVKAQLVGDEHGHFWKSADGQAYRWTEAGYETVDAEATMEKAKARRTKVNAQRMKRLPRRAMLGDLGNYTGKKKGLILLVNFSNKTFKAGYDNALYQRIANEAGFSEGRFHGSMADYFKDQSLGQFELDFDIVGPLTVSQKSSYYGKNDQDGNDTHPGEMVIEAVNMAKEQVTDWTQYDWDNDGYVDQVYVVYAGYGEADYSDENVIWPHAYTLQEAKMYGDGTGPVTVATGLKVDTYACGAELDGQTGSIGGIGVMCHEFSHCLGYPDFYDIDYSGGQGMGSWDLMDSGSYNDDGYQPAGYTSYERWMAGWAEPVVLETADTTVTDLASLQKSGKSFVIYNQHNRDEFFLLENRQFDGWDASLPGAGLLILHVDYSSSVWESNQPNDDPSHQRMTWMAADNKYQYITNMGEKYYTDEGMKNDPYPYGSNNAFNKDSKPAAQLYNKNTDGTKYLSSSVENIQQNGDGTIAFNFVANYSGGSGTTPGGDEPYVKPTVEGALFYESFDDCDGKGGNDNLWSDKIANGEFITDNEGWTANGYGANECAKFGNSKNDGSATTPAFAVNGSSQLTFRAGAWNSTKDGTTLNLSVSNGTISPTSVTMERGEFNDFEATISATGNVKITFASSKGRFFLDEVLVKADEASAISEVSTLQKKAGRIYTIDGRYVGTDRMVLPRGLYIIDGKKVLR